MADTSRIEKDWKTEEVETLIHHYENEPMLWDVSHSDPKPPSYHVMECKSF